jgi:DNA-directed RNA polymerase specialized sigma24 family protein
MPITDAKVIDAYNAAVKAAKWFARGRLHDDDATSEAGIAVTEAITDYDASRGPSFKSWVCRKTKWRVLQMVRRERRYEHPEAVFFDTLPARADHHEDAVDTLDDVTHAIHAGADAETITKMTGLSVERAKTMIARVLTDGPQRA